MGVINLARVDERLIHGQVTKSVYINKEDVDRLVEMQEKYGVENIYFQATPSAPRTELKDVVSKFK